MSLLALCGAYRNQLILRRSMKQFCTAKIPIQFGTDNYHKVEDTVLIGLNGQQDIMVKVASCQSIIQEYIHRMHFSDIAAKSLGELICCSSMMSASMKGEETLQINIVGNSGLRNLMVLSDSKLQMKALIGNGQFQRENALLADTATVASMTDLLGTVGQVQVVRNHPMWKSPMNGIVLLRDASIAVNMALYLAESEQRTAAMVTDVIVEDGICKHALSIMIEKLPGASEENVEKAIANVERVTEKISNLKKYLHIDRSSSPSIVLDNIMDDCLAGMDMDSIRWSKTPKFACVCSEEKVLRAFNLLPKSEIDDIILEDRGVQVSFFFFFLFFFFSPSSYDLMFVMI
jgi:molecular chaperone Hsp33